MLHFMRIQHANISPLNPDTLIAIHMLADFMDHLKDGPSERTDQKMTKEDRERLLIENILWGRISFGNPIRETYQDQYASLWTPPIREVLQVFHERVLDDLICALVVPPETIERYKKSPAFEYITTDAGWLSDEQAVEAWRKVKEQANQSLRLLHLPLRECYSLCCAILDARNDEFHDALRYVHDPRGADHTHMLRLRESEPIHFDFQDVACGHIRDTLRAFEQEYLDAFMADRIRWLNDTPKWRWQLEKVLPALQERARHFAHFWISVADPEFRDARFPGHSDYYLTCSCKLVETVLVLSRQQTIDILEIAPITCSLPDAIPKTVGLRFRVALHEESTEQASTAFKPVLLLTRNELTGELSINDEVFVAPHSGGTGDRIMTALMERNKKGQIVRLADEELRAAKGSKKYTVPNVLTDLGFTGDLRKAFFPTSSNNAVVLVNPVYEKDLKKQNIKKVPLFRRIQKK
jgi:hypothetical protein